MVTPAQDVLPGLKPIDRAQDDSISRSDEGSSSLLMPGFTFDVRKVRERATLLFPFLTPGLALERFGLAPQRQVSARLSNPFASVPEVRSAGRARRPPLVVSDTALQALIDKSWSRRDRWSAFQRILKLADIYNPDDGKLPLVLHAYLQQDGLQPYVDTSIRDPRLWTELGLAADHVKWVEFISRYAFEHPSTKATTELLFLLDNLTQASLDALVTLLNVDPKSDLWWTKAVNPDACRLLVDTRRFYKAYLERHHLTSPASLRSYYDNVRLAILTAVVRTAPHGYRSNDARFLIGTIYWRQRGIGAALAAWQGMTIDPTDAYATTCSKILTVLHAAGAGTGVQSVDRREIDRILTAEHGRWISFSVDRLREFGYRFDSY